jgi:long-chain acyl-CoA synthetase
MRHGASREAVVDGDRRLTYAELDRRIAGLNAGLRGLGVRTGDIVAVLMQNSLEYVECWLGLAGSGFVLNPLNFRLAERELEFILNDSGARLIIADARFFETAERLAEVCPAVRQVIWADVAEAPAGIVTWEQLAATAPSQELIEISENSLAAISYTGGTTGMPKGVMQTHGNLLSNARHMLIALPLSSADRFLHASPMFHAAGAANIFSLTWQGGGHVVLSAFDPASFCELVESERTTSTVIVPTMLIAIVNHPAATERDLSSWHTMGLSAAPSPVELLIKATAMLPCDIRQLYGATEASPHCTSTRPGDVRRWIAAEDHERLRSCGAADVGIEVEIRGLDIDADTERPIGEIGEVYIRGANVMLGYWRRPDETVRALTLDGWYRSGDLGYLDVDGYLYLVDRAKDMIISGGENVYTTEVENAIYAHPAVLEVAVFGIPDAKWGEAVHAEVVLKPGQSLTADELTATCREQIAGYKVPRSINLRTEPLPKSGANKILKKDLRAELWR